MINILKTLVLPFLFILPLGLIKIYNWDQVIENLIYTQPFLLALLLPGILITIRWVIKSFFKQSRYIKR